MDLFEMFEGARQEWMLNTACGPEDAALFFPISEVGLSLGEIAEAKAICHRCPVIEDCLRYAFEHGLDDGIFGGLTADERRGARQRHLVDA
jgi:WhiB family redox-sensing transcriptional regulator